MAETIGIEVIIFMVILFIVAPIIRIIDKALTRRWKKDLMDFEIMDEVIKIYHKYKKENSEIEKLSLWNRLKNRIKNWFERRKKAKNDRFKYGI